jgi:hypothetical protein
MGECLKLLLKFGGEGRLEVLVFGLVLLGLAVLGLVVLTFRIPIIVPVLVNTKPLSRGASSLAR